MDKLSQIESLLSRLELRHDKNDIVQLTSAIEYLENNDLSRLIERLLNSNKPHKFLETLTEVKFTVQLLRTIQSQTQVKVEYEPKITKRPIDLVITLDGISYFMQIKSLSNSIRETKQSRAVREIRRQVKSILCKRGLIIHVSKDFTKDNVNAMLEFVKQNLYVEDNKKILFQGGDNVVAEIQLQTPVKPFRDHMVLYSFGDLDAVDVTGITKEQIREGLIKAAGAFEFDSSQNCINLIVSEIRDDQCQARDFADALYGTMVHIVQKDRIINHRDNDGLFLEDRFSKKVAGVVVIHSKDSTLSSEYEKAICANPKYNFIKPILYLIHDRIIERFTWVEDGFFG